MQVPDRWREMANSFVYDDIYFFTVMILIVAGGSFGLGRVAAVSPSAPVTAPTTITLHQELYEPTDTSQTIGNFVASINGSRYHALSCPGAGQIKAENKIHFKTEASAQSAGYTRAKNCPK